MKIWDKIVFGGLTMIGYSLTAGGIYYCAGNHITTLAIPLMIGGTALITISCKKFCSKKDAYFECNYHKEEDIKEIANKLAAHQKDQIQEIKQEGKLKKQSKNKSVELVSILQEAPIAYPVQLQISNNEKEGPKGHNVENPFATNDIFQDKIDIVNQK